ncbi:MAG: UDP-3-O-(3-hydroxymyristoyl)glucosamine N-acyltransferase [Alphaproteobacteria bacterium]|nr:UDP-3-O-(3-hydroxymyristoyl)glucosamine N-acyltransferase [Alphaproteobacteria bacterium]
MVDTRFFKHNGALSIARIAEICDAEIKTFGKDEVMIENINTLKDAGKNEICFFYDRKKKASGGEIKATACVCSSELAQFVAEGVIVLVARDPKLAALKLKEAMYSFYQPQPQISAKASVAPTAQIGENSYIGDFAVIGENVIIGKNAIVEPFAVVEKGCVIGDNCRLGAHCYIAYAVIGNDCYIYNGARIGQDGFGFQTINGVHKRIPQIGRVIIGNDVEVGSCACIDRGALGDTVIGDGCRIDNLVQIAHNDKIGRGCIIVSQTGIAGSCTFGDYVVCGGQTGFADHLNVGSFAQVAAQSGVMRDIEPNTVVMGSPCVPFKDFMRQVAFLQKNSKK